MVVAVLLRILRELLRLRLHVRIRVAGHLRLRSVGLGSDWRNRRSWSRLEGLHWLRLEGLDWLRLRDLLYLRRLDCWFGRFKAEWLRGLDSHSWSADLEDINDASSVVVVGWSRDSNRGLNWLHLLNLLLLSWFRQLACYLFEGFLGLGLHFWLLVLLLVLVGRWLVVLGVLVLVERGLVVGVIAVCAQAVPVIVRLALVLLLVVVVVFGAVAAAAVAPVSTVAAVVAVVAAVAAAVARVALGSAADHAGHLLADVLGLDALLLEEFLIAEERDHGLGAFAD